MALGDVCNREVVITEKHSPISEVAGLMREFHVGDVVVVERRDGRNVPVGILTDRDIVVELVATKTPLDEVVAADVMSYELVTARDDAELLDTVETLRTKGIRRLPVVDAGGGLVGILTVDDVIDLLSDLLSDLSVLIARERRHEARVRRANTD